MKFKEAVERISLNAAPYSTDIGIFIIYIYRTISEASRAPSEIRRFGDKFVEHIEIQHLSKESE